MAGSSGPAVSAVMSVDAERDGETTVDPTPRTAWLSVGIATWIIGAFFVVFWAIGHGQAVDPALSVYIIPFYLGLAVLAAVAIALTIRATRQGRGWRRAFPAGYGVLAAGLLAVVAALIADVGWRGGVGDPVGIAALLAPTRLLIFGGLVLVAVGPLRWALRSSGAVGPRWPAVLSASLVLAVLGAPGGFHPAVSKWLERAPFTSNGEIWLMDGDGAHQTRLIEARDGAMAWNAAWSPDGTRLAYTRLILGARPPVGIPDEADIWIAGADGGDAHVLVEGPGWQWIPHWSPDGEWIVYTDEPEGGPWAEPGPAGLGGGGILGTGFGFGSPNPVRTYADIWRVRADGTGSPERITNEPGDDRAATFSPDGTLLAFDSTRAGGTDIFVMDADGSNARQLTFSHGFTWGATWSPDGSAIAFNTWRSDNQDIYRMDTDGGNEKRLTTEPGEELEPSWSPDGTRIAFRRISDAPDGDGIWSIAADGTDEQLLSRDPGASNDLISGGGAWAPDGRIVYMRGENAPADAHPLVREDLATAGLLLTAMLVAFIAVLLASIGPPFGSFAVLLAGPAVFFGAAADALQFIPGAVVGGLVVDLLVRFAPDRRKVAVAGAASAAAFVVGAEVTVALTTGLGWSASLLTGVVVASAAIGWGLAVTLGRPLARTTEALS